MIRLLYSALLWALQPLLHRKLLRRAKQEPGYGVHVPERFGFYDQVERPPGPRLWIHAVSLGESRAAAILLKELRLLLPEWHVILTHGTATGRAQGQALLLAGDALVWQPWDTPMAVNRFLQHFKPQAALLMETEVWPNWVAACQRQHIPMLLVNARMSEKSARQALRWSWLSQPAYSGLSGVWAQTQEDAQRLQTLGARVVAVTGNLKFDALPDEGQCALARQWRAHLPRPVIMLASSREGEEALWWQALRECEHPDVSRVQWLIVPRHPQRFDEIEQWLIQANASVSRRSQWGERGPSCHDHTIWLGDSLGEMALYYSLSDAALLGGSFAPLGGQNLIEAAACACPVVMGPHTFNFDQAAALALEAHAAIRVHDMNEAVHEAIDLVLSSQRQSAMSGASLSFSQQHRGAAARTAHAVLDYLKVPSTDSSR